MKKAVVVGATGLVGRHIVQLLSENQNVEEVIAITRREAHFESKKVVNKIIDFECLEDYSELFRCDALFSCLGTTRKQAGTIEAQRLVDFEYQLKVAQLAQSNNVKHYLLVSSSGADSKRSNPYFKMKGDLENMINAMDFQHISIFRPSLLMGDRVDVRYGEKLAASILPLLCRLPPLKRYRPITGEEVAKKMVNCSLNLTNKNQIELYTLDEVFP